MKSCKWQVSYLSNVVDLHTEERSSRVFTTLAENMAYYCVDENGWYSTVEFEMLDGAETLLPHFLLEQFADTWDWMPLEGTPKVSYDWERDILRLFNDKTALTSHGIAENLTVGCDEEGRPISVGLAGAAKLLLPYLLPVPEDIVAYATRR